MSMHEFLDRISGPSERELVDCLFAIVVKGPLPNLPHGGLGETGPTCLPKLEITYHAPRPYHAPISQHYAPTSQHYAPTSQHYLPASYHYAHGANSHGKFSPEMPMHGVIPQHLRKPLIVAALQLAGERVTSHNVAAVAARVQREESTWSTDKLNTWDDNARRGTPSCGPLQIIRPTFEENKVPGHNDLHNPLDSMAAAIRYARHRYGGIDKVAWRSGGY